MAKDVLENDERPTNGITELMFLLLGGVNVHDHHARVFGVDRTSAKMAFIGVALGLNESFARQRCDPWLVDRMRERYPDLAEYAANYPKFHLRLRS